MGSAFVAGVLAGYGVAIPVGAIAVLIIDTAVRGGVRAGLAAGAGAATADGLYALVAALFGVALAPLVATAAAPLRILAVLVLVAIALRGLAALRSTRLANVEPPPASSRATYTRMATLTLLNPQTVVYFAALILGLPATGAQTSEKLAFVGGAFLASLSWQSLLAAGGSLLHRRAPVGFRVAASLVGYLIVLAFAVRIGLQLVGP